MKRLTFLANLKLIRVFILSPFYSFRCIQIKDRILWIWEMQLNKGLSKKYVSSK